MGNSPPALKAAGRPLTVVRTGSASTLTRSFCLSASKTPKKLLLPLTKPKVRVDPPVPNTEPALLVVSVIKSLTLWTMNPLLPEDKPRYLMGVGAPEDVVRGVLHGVDMFDCVLPTRLARHGSAMIVGGRLNLRNAQYERDKAPLDSTCECYTCRHYSRAYLRHLYLAKEILSAKLNTIHNLRYICRLTSAMRGSILEGRWERFREEFHARRQEGRAATGGVE